MGLKCSILGHAYEPEGVEREREEQGSEVVTVVRELERCTRCGDERVVSESTEVTTVVEGDEVGLDEEATGADAGPPPDADAGGGAGTGTGAGTGPAGDERASGIDEGPAAGAGADPDIDDLIDEDIDPEDPEKDDAEILTDEPEEERRPGEWPDDADPDADAGAGAEADEEAVGTGQVPGPEDEADSGEILDTDAPTEAGSPERDDVVPDSGFDLGDGPTTDEIDPRERPDDEPLSGITVPEGPIVCPECDFSIEAQSGYRDGDPCPRCGAWLETDAE